MTKNTLKIERDKEERENTQRNGENDFWLNSNEF